MDWINNETVVVAILGLIGMVWTSMMKRETYRTQFVKDVALAAEISSDLVTRLNAEITRLNLLVSELRETVDHLQARVDAVEAEENT